MDGKFFLLIICASGTAFAGTWLLLSHGPSPSTAPRAAEFAATDKSGKLLHFANCEEVRRAGMAPLLAGRPGYTRDLDPDNSGVACPPY